MDKFSLIRLLIMNTECLIDIPFDVTNSLFLVLSYCSVKHHGSEKV